MGIESVGSPAASVMPKAYEPKMRDNEVADIDRVVKETNARLELENGRKTKQAMGKDDFLTLLVTQLKNQDPSAPMEDKQFIAQMAQFSSLEQMTNMAKQFDGLSNMLKAGQAVGMLGKDVDINVGNRIFSGKVDEVTSGAYPQVKVNGTYYDYADVARVKNN